MKNPNLELAFSAERSVRDSAAHLRELASAFFYVGNGHMGETLTTIADSLGIDAERFGQAISGLITERLRDSEEMTKTVVEAVFAGARLESQDGEAGGEEDGE